MDPATGAPTPAAGQVQISVEEAVAALDPAHWEISVAEERPRRIAGTGVDAVVRATIVAGSTYDHCLPPTRLALLNVCHCPQHVS